MRRALMLAERGLGSVEPNPMVGCVLVRDGICVGEGYHQRFGGPHAEIEALSSLAEPSLAVGATAYVTLEPCCHFGKTPPCSDALIRSGVSSVVTAMRDPFPKVDGGGLAQLKAAGIAVEVGVCQEAAEQLNAPYLKRLRCGKPWVIAKWAMSLDGKIATWTGDSQWISGEVSRAAVHRLRGRMDAVIVGAGTLRADNPRLTARPGGPRVATRVVMAGQQPIPLDAALFASVDVGPVMCAIDEAHRETIAGLRKRGVDVLTYTGLSPTQQVQRVLEQLGQNGATNVLVEGGGALLATFAEAGEIDEIHTYIAPRLLGGATALGPVAGKGVAKLRDAALFRLLATIQHDDDVQLILRRAVTTVADAR